MQAASLDNTLITQITIALTVPLTVPHVILLKLASSSPQPSLATLLTQFKAFVTSLVLATNITIGLNSLALTAQLDAPLAHILMDL